MFKLHPPNHVITRHAPPDAPCRLHVVFFFPYFGLTGQVVPEIHKGVAPVRRNVRKGSILLLLVVTILPPVLRAQEPSAADLSVGYSYLREGFRDGVNANGGTVSFTGYANKWLGITGDFGAYHTSPYGISSNTYTYLFGPRLAYRNSDRVAPFVQFLVGGDHLTAGAGGVSASTNGFAWSAGGGFDFGLTRHIAFRPQFDYIGLRAANDTIHTGRASASIVFRFGSR